MHPYPGGITPPSLKAPRAAAALQKLEAKATAWRAHRTRLEDTGKVGASAGTCAATRVAACPRAALSAKEV